MPVCVLEGSHRVDSSGSDSGGVVDRAGWERRVAEVAVSRTDRVTVSEWGCVQGLERRVVVWLEEWRRRRELRPLDLYSALPAMSRCTTQLIIVNPPRPDDTDTHSSDSTHLTHTHTPHSTGDKDETTEDI